MSAWEFTLPGRRRLVAGERPLIVGILNCTPDSFSDGGRYPCAEDAVRAGLKMLEEGADLIDLGGESTRPGSLPVPPGVQLERVLPVIRGLRERTDAPISIDTMSPGVADKAIEAGADILNDVSGCRDPCMQAVLECRDVPVILMHMKGTPADMQIHPDYPEGVVPAVLRFFEERLETLRMWGIDESRTILDPGIGFGKRVQHSLELIRSIDVFHRLGRPVLIGASRKGFIQKVLARDGTEDPLEGDRDLGTLIVNACALAHGADFLRVHNVPYARAATRMFLAVRGDVGREKP